MMDKSQIDRDRIIDKLRVVWHENPSLTLGQLVTRVTDANTFYSTDAEVEAGLDSMAIVYTPNTFFNLQLSTRAYNCLSARWAGPNGIADDAPVRSVLLISNIHRYKNFGIISFMEVVKALEDMGISRAEIAESEFVKTAPIKWIVRASEILNRTIGPLGQ